MTEPEETDEHYQGYGHDAAQCWECTNNGRRKLVVDLLSSIGPLIRAGRVTDSKDLDAAVRAIDSILDEWPR